MINITNSTSTTNHNYNYSDDALFILIAILILVTLLFYGFCCESAKESERKVRWQQERARARIELRGVFVEP